MKKIPLLISFIYLTIQLAAQNVGIGTASPAEKLEIKNAGRSTVKISSNDYKDTSQLILSNRNAGNAGTDFQITARREEGLFFTSKSDQASNINDSLLTLRTNGNIGLGNINPVEKLDVKGNINLTGTIKANGVDGNANQVLMKNNSGLLSWGDMCEYKNMATFTTAGSNTWNVPADVSRVTIEVWGAGGGGNAFSGGGGGGYVRGIFAVTPGSVINYTIGLPGNGASLSATNGANSIATVAAITLTAIGGEGSVLSAGVITNGGGGGFFVTGGFTNFSGVRGNNGTVKKFSFFSVSAVNYEETSAGDGGDAGNTTGTGGLGRLRVYNLSSASDYLIGLPDQGKQPGGGGGSGIGGIGLPSTGTGVSGGTGMVIIHY